DLAWTGRDSRLFAAMLLERAIPSYRCRLEIRANVAQALRGEVPTTRWANLIHQRNWTANRGGQVSTPPANAAAIAQGPFSVETICRHPAWYIHRLNAEYIKRFLELADSRAIPVYWLLAPIHPEVQARFERLGVDARHVRYLHKLQDAFPRMVVVD